MSLQIYRPVIINKINLQQNKLITKNTVLDLFKSTKGLAKLNLSNNSLADIGSEVLSHLNNLKTLDLSFNEFTKISSEVNCLYQY